MPKTHFTDSAIKNLGAGQWFDERYPNLYLRVGKKTRSWLFRLPRAADGSKPGKTLGRFPEINKDTAVKMYDAEKGRIARGEPHPDPEEEIRELEAKLKALKRAAGKLVTFGDLADDFMENYTPKTGRPWADSTRYNNGQLLRDYLLPHWRDRDAESLEEEEIVKVLDDIKVTKPPTALLAQRLLSTIYGWAVRKKKLQVNPTLGVDPPAEPSVRDRVLSPEELRAAWRCFSEIKTVHGLALKLAVLTWQRRCEVAGTPWSEITEGCWWELPKQRTKSKKRMNLIYLAPLSRRILEISKAESPKESAYIFRGYVTREQAIDKSHLTRLVTDISRRLVQVGAARSRFTLHDVRRTGATQSRARGVDRRTVETILNHGRTTVTDVYDLYEMKPEIEAALTTWNDYLVDLLGLKPGEV